MEETGRFWWIFLQIFQVIATFATVGTFFVYLRQLWIMQKQLKMQADLAYDTARLAREAAHQNVWQNLFSSFDHINDYIANFLTRENSVPMVPPDEFHSDQRVGTLLFHHLNLVFRFWVNKALMTDLEQEGMKRWVNVVFLRWVRNNGELRQDLKKIIDSKDLYPEDFLEWFTTNTDYQETVKEVPPNKK